MIQHFLKLFIVLFLLTLGNLVCADTWPGTKSDFHGFDRYDFSVDELKCKVVAPKQAAQGNPWVWRARFFGHQPQVDVALLEKGFHVAYVDVTNLFGSPKAVARWDTFYDYLVDKKGLSKKPALEGMSRGGLIIFNWASQNPNKVACIYADAPVCDFKSWPGGKGQGEGSPKAWKQFLKAYDLTQADVSNYPKSPLELLEPLAKNGVPLLHVVGDTDNVVPVAENTALLEKRYQELGGSIKVIHKPDSGHHPHCLKDPRPIVDFILAHTASVANHQATETSVITQRADSSLILDVSKARSDGARFSWNFDLTHPGTYVVQVVADLNGAEAAHSGSVLLDGRQLSEKLTKDYIIEDGLVSSFEEPAQLTEARTYSISIQSSLTIKYLRIVPQGYVKSRIHLSSKKYYAAWLKMHSSPQKVAAMEWYKQARFGMFIHWGVYSQAAGSWKGKKIEQGQRPFVAEWIMNAFQISRAEYREYARNFNPNKSFAVNIAKLAKDTGMKYVVITSKHHDGFALFNSAHSDFDVADSSDYQGDLIKELYDACRAQGIDFGVYYSHGNDWADGGDGNYANVKKRDSVYGTPTRPNGKNRWDPSPNTHVEYLESKAYPQIAELIKLLPDLRLIWFDGDGLITEEQAFGFYKMVFDLNPNIIVNRRVGYDFGDYVDAGDNKTPTANELAAKHFETCGTANHSWGFKAHDDNWKSSNQLLRNFVDIVSKGGNYLLNIGPDGQGKVPDPCVEGFLEMGKWVATNKDAIFGTTRWTTFNEGVSPKPAKGRHLPIASKPTEFWFSAKGDKVYAMSLVSASGVVKILSLNKSAGKITQLQLLGSTEQLKWTQTENALEIDFGGIETDVNGYVVRATLSQKRNPQ